MVAPGSCEGCWKANVCFRLPLQTLGLSSHRCYETEVIVVRNPPRLMTTGSNAAERPVLPPFERSTSWPQQSLVLTSFSQ